VIAVSERPLSDRRPHEHDVLAWEVRGWAEPLGRRRDVEGWRSLAWSATHDDAVVVAEALTTAHAYEFAEVWGPAETPAAGRTRTCERFPVPDGDERREMWLRAAAEHFTDGMDLPRRTTV
jgi:hypothetical protein